MKDERQIRYMLTLCEAAVLEYQERKGNWKFIIDHYTSRITAFKWVLGIKKNES